MVVFLVYQGKFVCYKEEIYRIIINSLTLGNKEEIYMQKI